MLVPDMTTAPSRSPAVAGARVYALFTANVTSGDQEVLAAVDASTGSTVWTFDGTARRTASAPNATRSAPVVAGGLVIFGSQDSNVYAVYASNGTLAWWFPTGAPVQTVPAVDGTIVYVTSGTKLFFLDLAGLGNGDQGVPDSGHTGDELLEVNATGAITASPVVAGAHVYVDAGGALQAIDKTFGGAPVWSTATGGTGEGTPAVWGPWIFARRSDGRVLAFDRASGRIEWVRSGFAAPTDGEDLAVAGGRVFLSAGSDLVALDATTGGIVYDNATASRPALGSPIAAGSIVLVAEGSRLLAYRGQPDLLVLASEITFNAKGIVGQSVTGNFTVTVRNDGDEPTGDLVVRVYEGTPASYTWSANLTITKSIKPGGLATVDTPDRAWSVGRHVVTVHVDKAPAETETGNNEATALVDIVAGPPPPPQVVGSGPYWVALLLGFGAGALVLYVPLRRLREVRRRETEPEPPAPEKV